MQKSFYFIIMLVISVAGLISCQKEVDWEAAKPADNDSTDIAALIILDTTYEPGKDTIQKFEFFYDFENRRELEKVTEYQPGVSGPGRILITRLFNYDYSGLNPLPFTMYAEHIPPSGTLTFDAEHFYFYQNGFLIKDSVSFQTSDDSYRVDEFIPITSSRYLLPGRWGSIAGVWSEDTAYSAVVWLDSNLLSQKDTLILSGTPPFQVIPHTLTYDNVRNPFLKVLLPYPTPCPTASVPYGVGDFIFPTKNNIRTWNYDGNVSTRTYEYGTNGLPSVVRDSDNGTVQKWIFQYTKL